MKLIFKAIVCLLFSSVIFLEAGLAQTSWMGTTSTSWTNAANWTNGVPTASLDAIIGDANFTGASQPSISSTATCKSLTIGAGAKVSTLSISRALTVSGNVVIGSNGTINQSGSYTLSLSGNWSNSGTYNANSNGTGVTFSGSAQSLTGATTFRKLTVNSGSTLTLLAAITVGRPLTISGTLDPGTFLVTMNNNFVVNAGATIRVKTALFSGNYSKNPTTLNGASTVEYASTTLNQTVSNSFTYGTLRISGNTTKTPAGNLPSLSSVLAANGNIFVISGTLDLTTFTANRGTTVAGGTINIANGATLKIGGTSSFPANYVTHSLGSTSTVEYSGTNQTVSSEAYGNLTLSSSSGAAVKTMPAVALTIASNLLSSVGTGTSVSFTAGNSMNIGGDVTIGSSTTFNGSSFTHTILGNWTNNGTFTGSTGKISFGGTNKSIGGTGTQNFNNLDVTGSGASVLGTVNLSVGGNLATIGAGTLTHAAGGTITMSGAGKTLGGIGLFLNNLTLTGTVTATSSFAIAGNLVLTGTGSLSATAGTIVMNGASKTISNTGSGTITFYGLSVTGSITNSTNFSMNSDLSVTGSLNATSGTVTFTGTTVLSGPANLFNATLNGTKLQLGGGAVLGIAGVLTLSAGTFDVTTSNQNTVNYNGSGAQSVIATIYHDLSISGSGTKTAAGPVTINGDMTINAGPTFAAGASTHILYGNFTNAGSFSAGTSTVQFAGGLDASISGSSVTTFNTLTLNKLSTNNILSLNSSASVGTLNMTSGQMHIDDTTKSVTITTTRTGGGVILGNVTRTHAFANDVIYEFESPTNYVAFNGAGTNPSSVTMRVTLSGPSDFTPAGTTIKRTFQVTQTGGSGYTGTLSFDYDNSELNGNDPALLHAWHYTGGAWVDVLGLSLTDGPVIKSGLTDITGRWTLQSKISGIAEWNGSVSNSWENPGNWAVVSGTPSLPPNDSVFVQIGYSTFTNQPTIHSNVVIRSLTLGSTQAMTLTLANGSSLNVQGSAGNLFGSYTSDITHLINVNNQSLEVGGNIALSDGTLNRRINISLGNGNITFNGRLDQAANSDITVTGNGTIRLAGDWIRSSNATFSPGTGKIIYNGNNDQIVAGGITYNNLDIRKPSGTATLSSAGVVTGNLSLDSTGGLFLVDGTSLAVSGDVTIAAGTTLSSTVSTFSFGGDMTGSGTFDAGPSTVILNGTGTQSLAGFSFSNLTVNKTAGSVILTGNVTINSDLNIQSGSVELSTFTVNRNSEGGTLTLGSGSSLRIGTGSSLPSSFSVYALNPTSSVEFYGTGAQSIPAITFGNLTLTNGGVNAKSLAGSATVAGDLLVNSGSTLNSGSFPLTLNGNWTNSGTFIPGTGTVELTGSTKSVTSSTNLDVNDLSVPGSYTFSGTQLHVFGNIDVDGSLDLGSTASIIDGDLTNRGTLTSNGTATFTGTRVQTLRLIGALLSASTGVVNFNGTVAPILNSTSPPTFVTLNINNTAGVTPSTGWTVFGPMTISSGSSFIGGSLTHTFFGTVTNNGTMTSSGTLNFTPPSAKTITLNGTQFTSTGTVNFGGTGQLSLAGNNASFNTLTISNTNGAGVALPSSWDISSNFNISSGATVHAGSGLTHTIGGTFTNSGTFDGGTSTVVLNNPTDAEITGGGATIFNNLTIAGVITGLSDIKLTGDFTNNGTFDGTSVDVYFTGSSPSTLGGTTVPTSFPSLINVKTGATTALAVDLIDVVSLLDSTGTLDLSTHTVTQDVSGGSLNVDDGATMKIGGSNTLPTFSFYTLTPASTVEYNGTGSQTVSNASGYGNLTLSNSGTKSAGGALAMAGNFSLSSATFTGGSFNHTLAGDWSMSSGVFSNSGTTITFNGTGTQNLSSTGAFNDLTVNKSSGVLNGSTDITVNGVLTFTSGNISTASNKVIIGSSGSVSRTSGHVVGKLQKNVGAGATSRTFEIGDTTGYTPINVSFASVTTAGNLTGGTTMGDHPQIGTSGVNSAKSVNRYWTLSNSGIVFTTYSGTFNFLSGDIDAGANTSNFVVRKYDGIAWTAPTVGVRTSTSTQITGIASFSDFQAGEVGNSPVPTTTSISPVSKNVGDPTFTLTVNGTNFVTNSVVRINGSDRTTTFVSSIQLTASIPASDLIAVGTDSIKVFSPSPGGGLSNAQAFTINQTATGSTLAASINPSAFGQSVTFTSTVTPTTGSGVVPAGTVTFKDGVTTLGTGSLNPSGQATYSTSGLSEGVHSITSIYAGDANFTTSTSSAFSDTVNPQIISTAGTNGAMSPSGTVSVTYGSNQSVTITPNTGYHIDSVIVDGSNQGAIGSYTFNNVTANHTIRSVFALNQYTITASSGVNGSISPSGSVVVNYGSNQSFTITANTGYHIDSVIVDGANQGAIGSYTFNTVTANHTIRSVFAIDQFTLTASTGANGSISPSGSVTANYGSNQSFTVTANTGYHIDSVIVDGSNQGAIGSYTFNNVTANHTIRSVFAIDQFTITASAGANGSISPSGSVNANYGSNQSFTVTANTGYHIDSVIVDGSDQGSIGSYTFNNVTANHTIRSVFAIDQFTITSSAGANGSISPSGSVNASYGSNQSFTVIANTGYHIDSVIVDGSNQGAIGSYTFNNVTANHTIRSVFAIDQFTITASTGANGSISPSGSVNANYGSNQSFTVTANTGYHIDSVIVDGANQGAISSYTFNNVTANHTIRSVFAIDQFTITASAGANGSISPSGSVSANYGSNQSFTLTANTGYHIDSIIVDGANQGAIGSYTFNNVTANHTIRSVFAIDQFTITVSAGANGSISPSGSVNASYGSNQSFTVIANTGYHIDSVIVDGADQGVISSYTFNNVTANHTIRSVFAIDQFTITASTGANGLISPSGSVNTNYGSNQSFTITANTGYHIDSVIVDGVDQGAIGSYTFNNVTANHTIRSVFAIDQFTITASAGANGAISPSGSVNASYGSNQSFTVTANTGYHVDSVIVDGSNQGAIGNYTFNNVSANHTIRSVFAIDQFTITASAGANGSISPSGSVNANYGSNQSFTIAANTGYHIDSVIVDGSNQGSIGSYTFSNVTANHTIRSVFAIDQFTITASAGGNGSISPSGSVNANYGSNQSFTVTANTGYHIDSVIVDGSDQGSIGSYTFNNVTANHTIRSVFAIDQFTITASAGANGSISPNGSVNANYGSNQSFTITANTGYHIDSVIVDGSNQGAIGSYTFNNVTANHTIRSVFAIDQFTITASTGANGLISPSGSVNTNYGSNQSFTVTANTGYHIDSVLVDGSNQGAIGIYTFNNVTANHTIRSVFAIDQFTITASAGANGAISPSGSVNANYGSNQSFTITANTGYHIDSVIVDGSNQGAIESYTFNNVTANHTIRSVFAIDQFTITSSAGANGSISPSGSVNANYGSNQSFTVAANTGYHIDSVIVDGANQGAIGSYTFNNVTANHTIRSVFAIDQFTITASSGANGTIGPNGSVIVNYGSNQAFTMTPNTGYHVDSVIVDGADQGSIGSYTFSNVTANHTIRSVFAIDQFTITASAGANGSISPSGSVNASYGSNQAFTVTANPGYHIDSVIVDGADQGSIGSYTFSNVTANHTIRSVFAIDQFTITASAGANGSISPSGSVNANYGSNQSFTITANTGYHIDSVIVDGSNQGAIGSYTFNNVTANHTIRSVFAIDQFTITSSAGANGSISPSGSVNANYGSNQSFTVAANTGYHIDSVIVDGANQGAIGSYTFNNVTANHTIRSVFAIDQFTITSSAGANGAISPSGSVSANYGSNQSFTITANTGYHIDSVLVDGSNQGAIGSYTFNNVTANHTIRTVFAIDNFTITATAGVNGTINPSGAVSVNSGANQSFTVTPNTGYHIDSVIVDGSNQGAVGSYTFNNVTANHTIRSVFAINQFTITSSSGANGTIGPNGSVIVNYGSNQAFTMTPNTGYHVDSVIVDGSNFGPVVVYTFTNVTGDHSIRVVYAIDLHRITATQGPNGLLTPNGFITVTYGSNQSFTITANTGYHIDSVLVDSVNQGAISSYTFNNITVNHTIRTVYAINHYTITASTGANGSMTPYGAVSVAYSANQTFTMTPGSGYHVDSVIVDGVNQGVPVSYTFTNVTTNHTILVKFAINRYTISASTGLNGTISPSGMATVTYGANQTYTMTPATGYHVFDVSVDGVSLGQISSYTFTNVTANHTIAVLFALNTYTITASAGSHGTVYPSGVATVTYSASKWYTITPDAGYIIDSVLVDGNSVGAPAAYTFTNVTSNHTLNAFFGILPASAVPYRSFVYDSMHVRKPLKKKPLSTYWEFAIVNNFPTPITEINLQFKNDVGQILSSSGLIPTGIRKQWVFAGTIPVNDTVVISGRCMKPVSQVITKLWLGPITGPPAAVNMYPRVLRSELPMPNIANVRDDAFGRGAFAPTNGLVVGVPRLDSAKYFGWVRMMSKTDFYRSADDRSGAHTGTPRGYDFFTTGKPFVKELKHLEPSKQNNRLFGDLMALKFNIAISALRITQNGFGELRYVENGSPFDGLLVREISARADSMMTFHINNPAYYRKLDSTVMKINWAFSGRMDTLSWWDSLKIKGTRPLYSVSYLTSTNIAPAITVPLAQELMQDVPEKFELYQNYPNPFNPTTTIEFDLVEPSMVTLKVYNMIGQEVATLINNEHLEDGVQDVNFDGSNLASGVYFYRMTARAISETDQGGGLGYLMSTKKMILVK